MMREGTTERLLLRPLEIDDASRIQELFPHWEIVRFLLNRVPWPYPADGALHYCRDVALPKMERGEEWHWTLRLRSAPERNDRAPQPNEGRGRQSRLLAESCHGRDRD